MAPRTVRPSAASLVVVATLFAASLQALLSVTSFVTAAPPQRRSSLVPRRVIGTGRFAPPELKPPLIGAERSPSGLAWQVLEKGSGGDPPGKEDFVILRYTGWSSTTAEMFDSSYLKQDDAKFKMNDVIAGWQEGISTMTPGEKRRFWIPGKLAYGTFEDADEVAVQYGPPLGDLVYDIEFVKVVPPEADGFLVFFGVAGALLLLLSGLYSTFNVPPERPEYDTGRLIAFDRPTS
eukprot:gb/GFBE01072736.1/.p1 GENE.gb/GFBE01072736.1/~~gb/GFBE01072736.1/.p1  ORF type:complete len:235 (+),score=60.09 gb/GFBE01072736.1/:1-705(+)